MTASALSALARAEALVTKAEHLREARAAEARADIESLRALLPLPKSGPARQKSAELLLDLDTAQSLGALGFKTLDRLLKAHRLRLSATTARRLIDEHERSGRPIPPKSRRLLRDIERQIATALRTGDAKAYEIGKLVTRVAKLRLHRLGTNNQTLIEWADLRFPTKGWRTLSRYRRISRFPKRTVLRHGILKLDLGLQYLDLTPADDKPTDLLTMDILVPHKGPIPFRTITASDLQRAVDALRTIRSTPNEPKLPRAAARRISALRSSLTQQKPEGAPTPSIDARTVRAGNRMIVLVTIHNLPLDVAQRLLASGGVS